MTEQLFVDQETIAPELLAHAKKFLEELSERSKAEIAFLSMTLNAAYGGQPVLGVDPERNTSEGTPMVVFAASCTCEECVEFNTQRELHSSDTFLGAALSYGAARLSFADRDEVKTAVKH